MFGIFLQVNFCGVACTFREDLAGRVHCTNCLPVLLSVYPIYSPTNTCFLAKGPEKGWPNNQETRLLDNN